MWEIHKSRFDENGIFRNDFAHPVADLGLYQRFDIIRTDRLVKLRNSVALQSKADIDGGSQTDAISGNSM